MGIDSAILYALQRHRSNPGSPGLCTSTTLSRQQKEGNIPGFIYQRSKRKRYKSSAIPITGHRFAAAHNRWLLHFGSVACSSPHRRWLHFLCCFRLYAQHQSLFPWSLSNAALAQCITSLASSHLNEPQRSKYDSFFLMATLALPPLAWEHNDV